MTAYLVVQAELTDSVRFRRYSEKVPQLVADFGGEYIVLGGKSEVLEGELDGVKLVIHRWPNMEAAKLFWNSPQYRDVKKLREGTGQFKVMLLEGRVRQHLE